MNFSARARYLLVTSAIITASAIQLVRGYRPWIVMLGALVFLSVGNLTVYLAGTRERAARRKQKRDYYAGTLVVLLASLVTIVPARAQLLGEPPIPAKTKKAKQKRVELEWMWQYSPPEGGREHDFIQDPNFRPFLEQTFTAPQSFWGLQTDKQRKSLPDTIEDFLAIPGRVSAEENRYITATGAVRHLPTSRGLLFADLNGKTPLIAFAAIDWIRASKTTNDPDAEYTLWLFVNEPPGPTSAPMNLPPALAHALSRWMKQPLAGSGLVEHVTAAILVDSDGTPHQIAVPTEVTQ